MRKGLSNMISQVARVTKRPVGRSGQELHGRSVPAASVERCRSSPIRTASYKRSQRLGSFTPSGCNWNDPTVSSTAGSQIQTITPWAFRSRVFTSSRCLSAPSDLFSGTIQKTGAAVGRALRVTMALDTENDERADRYMNSVLKIYCSHSEPHFGMPWQRVRQHASTSTGFVIAGRRILTNAHSVEYHTKLDVKKRESDRKYDARLLAIGLDCDCALLTVDDDEFWEGMDPFDFAPELPQLQDVVAVLGYPIGGESMSITKGVVSRVEVTNYAHGSVDLLSLQIDAAINSGNSGGPVINKDQDCVGIAFQGLEEGENIGYVIPVAVVEHFLEDCARNEGRALAGSPTVASLGVADLQPCDSPALRASLAMQPHHSGVLVRVPRKAAATSVLQNDDVLMDFNGVRLANDGTVPLALRVGKQRIAFSSLISAFFIGDEVEVKVLRDGEEVALKVELEKPAKLVPPHIDNGKPSYLIVGGLVLTPVSELYLEKEYGEEYEEEAPIHLLYQRMSRPQQPGQQVVIISHVLPADCNRGYEGIVDVQVTEFNGQKIWNMRQLSEAVAACSEPFLRFTTYSNRVVVLDTAEANSANPSIMETHDILAPASADLLPLLGPGAAVEEEHEEEHEEEEEEECGASE